MRTSALSRGILLALLVALVIFALGMPKAHANGKAFPPDHCSASSPFMAWTGVDGTNTFCDSGQDILSNALLPNCLAGQYVSFDGRRFYCADTNIKLPNCTDGQYVVISNGQLSCATPPGSPVYVVQHDVVGYQNYDDIMSRGFHAIFDPVGSDDVALNSIAACAIDADGAHSSTRISQVETSPQHCIEALCYAMDGKLPDFYQAIGECAAGDTHAQCNNNNGADMRIIYSCYYH